MSRRNLVWIGVVLAITLLFYALSPMRAGPEPVNRAYEALVEVDGLVRRHHVEPVADEHLVEGAIRGMMRKLDPYSGYIGPGEIETRMAFALEPIPRDTRIRVVEIQGSRVRVERAYPAAETAAD